MSEFSTTDIGSNVTSFDVGTQFAEISKVEMDTGDDSLGVKPYGNPSGYTLKVFNPWWQSGMVTKLGKRILGYKYQPYNASGAQIDPAYEVGDGIVIDGVQSGIFNRHVDYSSMITSDVSAPADEEIDHEFEYKDTLARKIARAVKDITTSFTVKLGEIRSSVSQLSTDVNDLDIDVNGGTRDGKEVKGITSRLNTAEQVLTPTGIMNKVKQSTEYQKVASNAESAINQLATKIDANVTTKDEDGNQTFGWALDSKSWKVYGSDKNNPYLKVTKDGLTVNGKVTATAGQIGDFSIAKLSSSERSYTSISTNGQTWQNGKVPSDDAKESGILLDERGIRLGKYFTVDNQGIVKASNIQATGGTIGNLSINTTGLIYKELDENNKQVTKFTLNNSGLNLGGGKFKVTMEGKVTASDIAVNGGTLGAFTVRNILDKKGGAKRSVLHTNGQVWKDGNVYAEDTTETEQKVKGTGIYLSALGLRIGDKFTVSNSGELKFETSGVTDKNDKYYMKLDASNGIQLGRASGDDKTTGYFSVNRQGVLTATSANITGEITATKGSFTGQITATSGSFGSTANSIKIQSIDAGVDGEEEAITVLRSNSQHRTYTTTSNGKTTTKPPKDDGVYLSSKGLVIGRNFEVDGKGAIRASSGTIGGLTIQNNGIGSLVSSNPDVYFNFNDTKATSGIFVGKSGIKLGQNFSVSNSGVLTAKSGKIGGFTIDAGKIKYASGDKYITIDPNLGIYLGGETKDSSKFYVSRSGELKATNADISGTVRCSSLYIGDEQITPPKGKTLYEHIDGGISGGLSYNNSGWGGYDADDVATDAARGSSAYAAYGGDYASGGKYGIKLYSLNNNQWGNNKRFGYIGPITIMTGKTSSLSQVYVLAAVQ